VPFGTTRAACGRSATRLPRELRDNMLGMLGKRTEVGSVSRSGFIAGKMQRAAQLPKRPQSTKPTLVSESKCPSAYRQGC
jgi:hypothetical protein